MRLIFISSYSNNMKKNKVSQDQIPASVLSRSGPMDFSKTKMAFAPSSEEVARRAYSIYEKQGSQPGHEVRHWLEAEAQLFGGVERESQMHSGSSLFKIEH
jgi:hypothetical protein